MSKVSILHLSDIHFKKKDKEELKNYREDAQNSMVEKIMEHLAKNKLKLDFVAVTGDIAFSGKEYDEALRFFKKLSANLSKLSINTQILPVPGNHDVNRKA
jgi:3',5'-cyclic AMP phosphodiesterase CpdA